MKPIMPGVRRPPVSTPLLLPAPAVVPRLAPPKTQTEGIDRTPRLPSIPAPVGPKAANSDAPIFQSSLALTIKRSIEETRRRLTHERLGELASLASPDLAKAFAVCKRLAINDKAVTFVDAVGDQLPLAEKSPALMPLMYAMAAGLDGNIDERTKTLRDQINTLIATKALPETATAILAGMLELEALGKKQGSDVLSYRIMSVGVCAAAVSISDPTMPPFNALVAGMRPALRQLLAETATDAKGREAQLAATWAYMLEGLRQVLPSGTPARDVIEKGMAAANGQSYIDMSRTCALTLGRACYLLDHGSLPPVSEKMDNRDVMPALSIDALVEPIHVRELKGPLGTSEARASDVAQGIVGDCWLAATAIAVALARPQDIATFVKEFETTPVGEDEERFRNIRVRFQTPVANAPSATTDAWIDTRVYARRNGAPIYGSSRENVAPDTRRTWFPALEKAAANVRGPTREYGAINVGDSGEVFTWLYGANAGRWQIHEGMQLDMIVKQLVGLLRSPMPVTISTRNDPEGLKDSPFLAYHIYAVKGIERRDGQIYVHLVNPHPPTSTAPKSIGDVLWSTFFDPWKTAAKKRGEMTVTLEEYARAVRTVQYALVPGIDLVGNANSLGRVVGLDDVPTFLVT